VAVGERNQSFGESEKWDLQQVGSGFVCPFLFPFLGFVACVWIFVL
jgi:hypothetical protein